jgi:hypothetical protein
VTYSFQVDSSIVSRAYCELDNFCIVEGNGDLNLCVIYFSSHEIYYPNVDSVFQKKIINDNRFEWFGTRIKNARKHIFLRDIHKQWYLTGINSTLNDIESLSIFLNNETKGMDIVTIGSSAGGYAAVLFGHLLGAKRIFAFNSQFSIEDRLIDSNEMIDPIVFRKSTEFSFRKYYDISKFVSFNVFYFCSKNSHWDFQQLSYVKDKNLNIIMFTTGNHGIPFFRTLLPSVINFSEHSLVRYSGRVINPIAFSISIQGVVKTMFDTLNLVFLRFIKKMKEEIFY